MFGEPCNKCIVKTSCTSVCNKASSWYRPQIKKLKDLEICKCCGSLNGSLIIPFLRVYIISCSHCHFAITIGVLGPYSPDVIVSPNLTAKIIPQERVAYIYNNYVGTLKYVILQMREDYNSGGGKLSLDSRIDIELKI